MVIVQSPSKRSLQNNFLELRKNEPKIRIRDAAKRLEVSELELLEFELGESVLRLEGNWKSFLRRMHTLCWVMALTRNEFAVHERKGVYDNVSFMKSGSIGVAVGPDIDLRFFLDQWKYGYAVCLEKKERTISGFQFFNEYGEAVHKIYLTEKSDLLAYNDLLEKFRSKDQSTFTRVLPKPIAEPVKTNSELDRFAFQTEWLDLKDTHDFFPLLRKYKVSRIEALLNAPEGYACPVAKNAIEVMLEHARDAETPIMVFVGSKGCIQIHTGTVHKLVRFGNWYNVMDPHFNLHLNMEGVSSTWVVRKPTSDGIVTSLEVFDNQGELIAYCFGKRKPGSPELEVWREIIKKLPPLQSNRD